MAWGSIIWRLGLALSAIAPLPAAAQDTEVIGHYYSCQAEIQLPQGKISASRSLDEHSLKPSDSDFANWSPAVYRGVSVDWFARPGARTGRLSELAGQVKVFVNREKKLPKITDFTLFHPDGAWHDVLVLPMKTDAEPRLGSLQLPLRVLLAYAGPDATLKWMVTDPRKRNFTYERYAEGELDVAALRDADAAIRRAEASLDEMAADPQKNCTLQPIYYDPSSEI